MTITKRQRQLSVIGSIVFIMVLLSAFTPAFFSPVENFFLNMRAYFTMSDVETAQLTADSPTSRIVFIDVDDESLSTYGKWPWKRSIYIPFLQKLENMNAKLVFVDIYFPEKSDDDADFAAFLKKYPNIGFVYNFYTSNPQPVDEKTVQNINRWSIPINAPSNKDVQGVFPTISPISDYGFLGHDFMKKEDDDRYRYIPEYIIFNNRLYPSISSILYLLYYGYSVEDVKFHNGSYILKDLKVPVDKNGKRLVHYYSAISRDNQAIRRFSFSEFMAEDLQYDLTGKIVFFGLSARGLTSVSDLKMTAVGEMPGMEYLANATINLFEKKFIREIPRSISILIFVFIATVFGFLTMKVKGFKNVLTATAFIIGFLMLGYFLYTVNIYIQMGDTFIGLIVMYIGTTYYKYMAEEKEKKMIRSMFSSYVSESIVRELIKNPELATLQGKKRDMSVLFSDIKGFTTFTEKHEGEYVVQRLNEYLQAMTESILDVGGTLDKFVGDEIMALFGAPLDTPDNASIAVRAALAMRAKLKELQAKWLKEGKEILDMGIGVNSGDMLVGNIGAEGKKMDYTVIGDNVNLGARIEALTRVYGVSIIITELTFDRIDPELRNRCREIDLVKVKGKNEPARLYQVMEENLPPAFMFNFTEGLKNYRAKDWDSAERLFKEALSIVPDDVTTQLFLERIDYYRHTPPPSPWDGSFTMTEK